MALRESDIEHRGAAVLDPLTGMLNRSALNGRVAEIEEQSKLTGQPVGLIVADLDHFKAINDTHGHAVGDAVLRHVAYVLRRELRAYDLAYRLGGEEFAIVLLGADRRRRRHAGRATARGDRRRAVRGPSRSPRRSASRRRRRTSRSSGASSSSAPTPRCTRPRAADGTRFASPAGPPPFPRRCSAVWRDACRWILVKWSGVLDKTALSPGVTSAVRSSFHCVNIEVAAASRSASESCQISASRDDSSVMPIRPHLVATPKALRD